MTKIRDPLRLLDPDSDPTTQECTRREWEGGYKERVVGYAKRSGRPVTAIIKPTGSDE